MRKPANVYVLKVCLSCQLAAPLIWYFPFGISDPEVTDFGPFPVFYFFVLVIGFICSIPCFFLLRAGVFFFDRQSWRLVYKRLLTAVLAAGIVMAAFAWIGDRFQEPDLSGLMFIAAYVLLAVMGVFLFKWPGREAAEADGRQL
jgi:hypothetical protein